MQFIKIENSAAHPHVKIISLNRPDVRNAFHPQMIKEITDFFSIEGAKSENQLIIFKGEGATFCAGADLNWMKSMVNYSFEENVTDSKKLWAMFESIQSCKAPVVTIAQGAVFGGALGLLACSDYVYAEEKTQFCFSEVRLGLSPAVISGFISKKIQDSFYRPLMLSAEVFDANDALRIGLAHKKFQNEIDVTEVANKFLANGTEAMKETKKLLNTLLDFSSVDKRQENCTRIISERRMSPEGQQRLQQFLTRTNK